MQLEESKGNGLEHESQVKKINKETVSKGKMKEFMAKRKKKKKGKLKKENNEYHSQHAQVF